MNTEPRQYFGNGFQNYNPLDGAWPRREPYRPEQHLVEAVNMALELRRPLLLEGDPGAGKTRLAYAVAWELGWPLHTCYVRSTSRAEDLLYEFEQLNRLYDIQAACALMGSGKGSATELKDKEKYLTSHPLGRAIKDAQDYDRPSVVLIDEIDKADIDFPNDLLQVLEEWRFSVKEIMDEENKRPFTVDALRGKDKKERKDILPLVIITSNREKDLPPAFLRRCLYYFIEFPKPDKLIEILSAHLEKPVDKLIETAVERFMELRDQPSVRWHKKPGASELIDWVTLLDKKIKASDLTIKKFRDSTLPELDFMEALIKKRADLESLKALVSGKE